MSPKISEARIARGSVQGIHSDISDLVLRNGKEFIVRVGGAVIPTPTLTRDMEASSSVQVAFHDQNLNFLSLSLLSEKFDAEIDGLKFRYLGASKSGRVITITLEDQVIARLRELKGPKKAYRSKTTRAEFIISMVEELKPAVSWFCPQLEEKQPIKSERQAKTAVKEAKENREPGVGDFRGLTVKGVAANATQKECAEIAHQVAQSHGAPFRVEVALFSALIVETLMGSYGPGMANVLEGTGPTGAEITDAATEIKNFLIGEGGYPEGGAIKYYAQNPQATFYEIAQELQNSGAGESTGGAANYGAVGNEARSWTEAAWGTTEDEAESGSETVKEPYTFTVGKDETYWAAIQRLAKEVNWRAFVVAGRFYFISEPELSRGQVRLAIERDAGEPFPNNPGIEDVDFDFNANKPVTELTVTALAKHWTPPPGSVVTVEGYGPASLGPGDVPPEKGKTVEVNGKKYPAPQLSSAVKASTHEGKGRYLVTSIEVPLEGDPETRQITTTLRKPTQPLPEKAAQTKTLTNPSGTEGVSLIEGGSTGALQGVKITGSSPGPPDWGGAAAIFKQFVHPFMADHGLSPGDEKAEGHAQGSDHALYSTSAYATDYPTTSGATIAKELATAMGDPGWQENSYDSFNITVSGLTFQVQILWGAAIDHADHVHVGMHRV